MEELKFKNKTLGSIIITTIFLIAMIWLFVSVGGDESNPDDIIISILIVAAFFIFIYSYLLFNSTVFKVNESGIHFDFMGKKSISWENIESVRIVKRDSKNFARRGHFNLRDLFKKEISLMITMKPKPIKQSAANLAQIRSAGYTYEEAMQKMGEIQNNIEYRISLDGLVMKPEEVHALLQPYIRRYCPNQEFVGSGVGTDGVLFTELEF